MFARSSPAANGLAAIDCGAKASKPTDRNSSTSAARGRIALSEMTVASYVLRSRSKRFAGSNKPLGQGGGSRGSTAAPKAVDHAGVLPRSGQGSSSLPCIPCERYPRITFSGRNRLTFGRDQAGGRSSGRRTATISTGGHRRPPDGLPSAPRPSPPGEISSVLVKFAWFCPDSWLVLLVLCTVRLFRMSAYREVWRHRDRRGAAPRTRTPPAI